MKKLIVVLFCCLNIIAIAQQTNPNQSLKSPEVLPGNKVAFRIYAPNAKNVTLRSDDKWDKIEFNKDEKGVWEGIWNNVESGAYRYHFIVDGLPVYDPMEPMAKEKTAVLLMTSGDEVIAMKDNVPHGAIAQRYYYSKTVNKTRRMHVWTPAGYEKSKDKLPVLYLVHGGGDVDNAWTTVGCAGNILDNLLAEGKIEPMLVVMPNGTIQQKTETMLEKVPIFNEDLMINIIPFVESNYNVRADAKHRAIMGLSFGGLETLEAATSHPEMFDYVVALSSGWWISDEWQKERGWMDDKAKRVARMKEIGADFNKSVKLMYFTQGGSEDLAYANGHETMKIFDEAGITYKYSESPGGHTWKVWRKNLNDILPLLFK
ncbi:alpha/beta hydrolase-fold protein [Ancylomarina sp. 16SWW S1-10-2]|uniref:alpha/beta hydrolase-fold protein n=1 Tax=Ancylomarina sp. 16SWW S1-10-2 TaxID=2499681 RepID=UPI0012AE3635|nr:alpha/beta hydrolase-fold protein [Ancylomarina sp. 16SWW S1-10-2]MRT93706.1 endo-1,4-beta-xylanase Z [Ancylomarina sp. 16SWW S1-10-2]